MAKKNPISQDRFREIEQAIVQISDLRSECNRFEACGVDCTDRMAACDYLQSQLQTLLDVWRDGKPPPASVSVGVS